MSNQSRLQRLLAYLERDPANRSLLSDAAEAAYGESQPEAARDLLDRLADTGELSPGQRNLRAVVALAQGRFADAGDDLTLLRASGDDRPEIRFNLAWTMMMEARFEEALDLLDPEAVAVSPKARMLKVQALHHLERYDDALQAGAELARLYPDDDLLMGALATVAMDADELDLSRAYAARAGTSAEGLSAQGLFALDAQDSGAALALFERSLEQQPANPRSWVGKGLALLGSGQAGEAAVAIERGATLFEDHLGSWVAAGWAHFIAGNAGQARAAFDRVVAIDPAFAEGHGGLAVLDIMAGKGEEAERQANVALRLDRNSLGGTLAKSMLLESAGKGDAAQRLRALALDAPIGAGGKTLAQALAGAGSGMFRR